jgi:hypothetical protein
MRIKLEPATCQDRAYGERVSSVALAGVGSDR